MWHCCHAERDTELGAAPSGPQLCERSEQCGTAAMQREILSWEPRRAQECARWSDMLQRKVETGQSNRSR
jgi:hypothetical protein